MNWKEFEEVILQRIKTLEEMDSLTGGRYGVQGAFHNGEWRPIRSLPDFEGVLSGGRQWILEAKVCNAASFSLSDDKFKERQLRHLLKRSDFGALCGLLIHMPARELSKSVVLETTFAMPVYRNHPIWIQFDAGEIKSLSRTNLEHYAGVVKWDTLGDERKPRPDILGALRKLESLGHAKARF